MADTDQAASLKHGPNPALFAQPGVDAEAGYSQAEYDPEGFDPFRGGLSPAVEVKAKPAKAPPEDEVEDEGAQDEAAQDEEPKAKAEEPKSPAKAGPPGKDEAKGGDEAKTEVRTEVKTTVTESRGGPGKSEPHHSAGGKAGGKA
jgi:hypothetical protein